MLRRQHASVEETWLGRKGPRLAHGVETARQKFNHNFQRTINWYVGNVGRVVERKWLFLVIYVAVCVLLVILYRNLPTGFGFSNDLRQAISSFRDGIFLGHQRLQIAI